MKRITLFIVCGMVISLVSCQQTGENSKERRTLFPYTIYQNQLSNGLRVVTVPFQSPGVASLFIVVRVGSRNEVEQGKTGFAHFFEHMMFRGTDRYPKEVYDDTLKSTGASANANTSFDRTVYHMTGNRDKLETMFRLEADRFMHLHYTIEDFRTEAGAVKGEYTKNYANPYEQLDEALSDTAFEKHTYKHTTMGFWKDVVDMPNQYDYSLQFFNRFYRPEYTTILVTGDVTPDEVNRLADRYFSGWKRGDYVPDIPAEPRQNRTRYTHVQAENFPPYLSLNYKGPGFTVRDKDNAALDVIAQLLFSNRSGLYKKLVLRERKCRFINGQFFYTVDPYLFSANASVYRKEDMQYVKDEITKAIDQLKENGPDVRLLNDTKSFMKYSFIMELNSSASIAQAISYSIWVSNDPESIGKLYYQIEQLTPEDIKTVANKYFVPGHLTIATISPEKEGGVK